MNHMNIDSDSDKENRIHQISTTTKRVKTLFSPSKDTSKKNKQNLNTTNDVQNNKTTEKEDLDSSRTIHKTDIKCKYTNRITPSKTTPLKPPLCSPLRPSR